MISPVASLPGSCLAAHALPQQKRQIRKTYSRRTVTEDLNPSIKRKQPESTDTSPLKSSVVTLPLPQPTTRKKISDYFRPFPSSSTSPAQPLPVFSSDPAINTASPPSSVSSEVSPSLQKRRTYTRRRISSRPSLPRLPVMSNPPSLADPVDWSGVGAASGLPAQPTLWGRDSSSNDESEASEGKGSDVTRSAGARSRRRRQVVSVNAALTQLHRSNGGSSRALSTMREPRAGHEDGEGSASMDIGSDELLTTGGNSAVTSAEGRASRPPISSSGSLRQTQIDSGSSTLSTCRECYMEYNTSIEDDRNLHQLYHDDHMQGPSYNRVPGAKVTPKLYSLIDTHGIEEFIVAIDHLHTPNLKCFSEAVLHMADKELGCKEITAKEVWSTINIDHVSQDHSNPTFTANNEVPLTPASDSGRFKVYLYVKNGRAVGCLLAERIKSAKAVVLQQVQCDEFGPFPSEVPHIEVVNTNIKHDAFMGINRLWVHKNHQRLGYATQLITVARGHFYCGGLYKLGRHEIAFTELTGRGSKLARDYMGKAENAEYHWLSYDEEL